MDAEAAFFDDLDNLVDPDLAGVLDFKLATSPEATIFNGEYHRPKKWLIRWVERTIDKDASLVIRRAALSRGGHGLHSSAQRAASARRLLTAMTARRMSLRLILPSSGDFSTGGRSVSSDLPVFFD